jgi:hypothetical protein
MTARGGTHLPTEIYDIPSSRGPTYLQKCRYGGTVTYLPRERNATLLCGTYVAAKYRTVESPPGTPMLVSQVHVLVVASCANAHAPTQTRLEPRACHDPTSAGNLETFSIRIEFL